MKTRKPAQGRAGACAARDRRRKQRGIIAEPRVVPDLLCGDPATRDRFHVVDHRHPRRSHRILELRVDVVAPAGLDVDGQLLDAALEMVVDRMFCC